MKIKEIKNDCVIKSYLINDAVELEISRLGNFNLEKLVNYIIRNAKSYLEIEANQKFTIKKIRLLDNGCVKVIIDVGSDISEKTFAAADNFTDSFLLNR